MDRETRDLERRYLAGDESALLPLHAKHVRSGLTHLEAMDAIWLSLGATVDSIPDLDEFAFERELELGTYPVDAVALCEKVGIQPSAFDEVIHSFLEDDASLRGEEDDGEDAATLNNQGLLAQLGLLLDRIAPTNPGDAFRIIVGCAKDAGITWPEIGRPALLYVRRAPYVSWIGPEDKKGRIGTVGMIVSPLPDHLGVMVTAVDRHKRDPKQVVGAREVVCGYVYGRSVEDDVKALGLDGRIAKLLNTSWLALSEDPEDEPFTPPVTPLKSFWTVRRGLDYAAISGLRPTNQINLVVDTPDPRRLSERQFATLYENHEVDYVRQRNRGESFEANIDRLVVAFLESGNVQPHLRLPEQVSLDKGSLVWDPAPRMRSNSGDEEIRELERRVKSGDDSAREPLLRAKHRRGAAPRVAWLMEKLSLSDEAAIKVAAIMDRVDVDPYGYNLPDGLEEIAAILAQHVGRPNDFETSAAEGDDEPWFAFVKAETFDTPTLAYNYRTSRWSVTTENQIIDRINTTRPEDR